MEQEPQLGVSGMHSWRGLSSRPGPGQDKRQARGWVLLCACWGVLSSLGQVGQEHISFRCHLGAEETLHLHRKPRGRMVLKVFKARSKQYQVSGVRTHCPGLGAISVLSNMIFYGFLTIEIQTNPFLSFFPNPFLHLKIPKMGLLILI